MIRLFTLSIIGAAFLLSSCHDDMRITGRIKPQQESDLFTDRNSSRPLIADTVVYGSPRNDDFFYRGSIGDRLVKGFPAPITIATLAKGRERYNIYCSVCHGLSGEGDGMIVQRGFP
ncbi:MAG: cytochrome c, partial [Verrucomicrobia bacterium]|nr:cytochrome c [Verrucomicrobiota bacterium]